MENRNHAPRTLAEMVRALDDPAATPGDICAARDWGAITSGSAVAWLRGYAAGTRDGSRDPRRAGRRCLAKPNTELSDRL